MTGTRVQEDSNVWYSIANRIPAPLPDRITLPDGRVRSDPTTYTDEEIADAGYVHVEPPPGCDFEGAAHNGGWSGNLMLDEIFLRNYRATAPTVGAAGAEMGASG